MMSQQQQRQQQLLRQRLGQLTRLHHLYHHPQQQQQQGRRWIRLRLHLQHQYRTPLLKQQQQQRTLLIRLQRWLPHRQLGRQLRSKHSRIRSRSHSLQHSPLHSLVLQRILLRSRAQHGEQQQPAARQQQQEGSCSLAAYRSSNRVAGFQLLLCRVVALAACLPVGVAAAVRAPPGVAPCLLALAASWQQHLLLLARTVVHQ
jgi:hypothetical protein